MEETFHLRTTNPETWMSSYLDGTISELWHALEDDFHERKQTISFNQMWLERFQDPDSYYCYPMSPEQGALSLANIDFYPTMEDALHQFEEDWEYEKWLKEVDELTMISNLNAAQSRDPEERTGSTPLTLNGRIWQGKTGWCGEVVETMGDSVNNMMDEWKKIGRDPTEIKHVHQGQIGHVLLKDRYKIGSKILENNFAETPYGIAWFPPKFQKFIPGPGNYCILTMSKNSGEKLTRHRAQFTVVYIHTGTFAAEGCGPSFR